MLMGLRDERGVSWWTLAGTLEVLYLQQSGGLAAAILQDGCMMPWGLLASPISLAETFQAPRTLEPTEVAD
jgi:hypothetical protein